VPDQIENTMRVICKENGLQRDDVKIIMNPSLPQSKTKQAQLFRGKKGQMVFVVTSTQRVMDYLVKESWGRRGIKGAAIFYRRAE